MGPYTVQDCICVNILQSFCQLFLKTVFPNCWKLSRIYPLFKIDEKEYKFYSDFQNFLNFYFDCVIYNQIKCKYVPNQHIFVR